MSKSRARSSQAKKQQKQENEANDTVPTLDSFLEKRDYEGALCLINFLKMAKQMDARVRHTSRGVLRCSFKLAQERQHCSPRFNTVHLRPLNRRHIILYGFASKIELFIVSDPQFNRTFPLGPALQIRRPFRCAPLEAHSEPIVIPVPQFEFTECTGMACVLRVPPRRA